MSEEVKSEEVASEEEVVKTGTVAWFSPSSGYGFIKPDEEGRDMFCHYSNIEAEGFKTLHPEQRVQYKVGKNDKGPQAVNIKVIRE